MIFLRRMALVTTVFLFFAITTRSQSGNNQIQIGAQGCLPTGDLSTLAKLGKGYSAKGLFGFGTRNSNNDRN